MIDRDFQHLNGLLGDFFAQDHIQPVSYTHLTLPTICSV